MTLIPMTPVPMPVMSQKPACPAPSSIMYRAADQSPAATRMPDVDPGPPHGT
jgi:hypothetical protein